MYDQQMGRYPPRAGKTAIVLLVLVALCLALDVTFATASLSRDSQAHMTARHHVATKRLSVHGRVSRWANHKARMQVRQGKRWLTLSSVHIDRSGRFHLSLRVSSNERRITLRLVVGRGRHPVVIWRRHLFISGLRRGHSKGKRAEGRKPEGKNAEGNHAGEPSRIDMLRDYHLHIVYWTPPGSVPVAAEVSEAISGLERNVQSALAAGEASNIFAIPGRLTGPKGPGDPRIASIEEVSSNDALTPAGDASLCAAGGQDCATVGQIESEVEARSEQARWGGGEANLMLIYASRSLVVCMESGCTPSSEPCGFHGYTASGQAYGVIALSGGTAKCGAGPNANVNYGEYAIALTGHEQNEAVADPTGTGTEIADPCEGHFALNVINGVPYELPELMLNGSCSAAAGAP